MGDATAGLLAIVFPGAEQASEYHELPEVIGVECPKTL